MSTHSHTQTPPHNQAQTESTSSVRRLGGFVKKMVLAFVLTLPLFVALEPIIGISASWISMGLAAMAVKVYYADPEPEDAQN